jgi:membrane protein insertase Oxa1/YidC/SpoIIIJ
MGAAMIWQTKMGSPMAMSGPAAQQQIIMKWVMPIMFIFIHFLINPSHSAVVRHGRDNIFHG